MGQQQLILIVLCTIVVGVAIAVGLVMFATDATMAARDALMEDVVIIISNARTYFLKPTNLGGGGNSFNGFKISARMSTNENGTYVTAADPTSVKITAFYNDGEADDNIVAVITSSNNKIAWTFNGVFSEVEESE